MGSQEKENGYEEILGPSNFNKNLWGVFRGPKKDGKC